MHGLTSVDRQGEAPAKKPTIILTNMIGAEKYLTCRCDRNHRHVELVNNRAKVAQVYPRDLCKAFIDSLKLHDELWEAHCLEVNEIEEEKIKNEQVDTKWAGHDLGIRGESWADEYDLVFGVCEPELCSSPKDDLHEVYGPWKDYHYFDEATGMKLDPVLVRRGDDRELATLQGRGVYDYAPRGRGKPRQADQDTVGADQERRRSPK